MAPANMSRYVGDGAASVPIDADRASAAHMTATPLWEVQATLRRYRGEVVECERHLVALDIDLKDAIDRLPDPSQFIEYAEEKPLLLHTIDAWNDNDKAGVDRLHRIKPSEVAGVFVTTTKSPSAAWRATFQSFHPALPTRATCCASCPAWLAIETKSMLRHSSIRNLISPQSSPASGGCSVPAADRARAAHGDAPGADMQPHKSAPDEPSRPLGVGRPQASPSRLIPARAASRSDAQGRGCPGIQGHPP